MASDHDNLGLAIHDALVGAVASFLSNENEAVSKQDFYEAIKDYVGHSPVLTKSCRSRLASPRLRT